MLRFFFFFNKISGATPPPVLNTETSFRHLVLNVPREVELRLLGVEGSVDGRAARALDQAGVAGATRRLLAPTCGFGLLEGRHLGFTTLQKAMILLFPPFLGLRRRWLLPLCQGLGQLAG